MSNLQITKIKPNPSGKDRSPSGSTGASQLAGEWVDIKNVCSSPVKMDGVDLYHIAYSAGSTQGHWDKVTGLVGVLPAGYTMRVHSGSGPETAIRNEDRAGAEYHVFTYRDYVWNNRQSDSPTLYIAGLNQNLDQASYDAFPPEGQVLVRSGAKLVAVGVPAYAR